MINQSEFESVIFKEVEIFEGIEPELVEYDLVCTISRLVHEHEIPITKDQINIIVKVHIYGMYERMQKS